MRGGVHFCFVFECPLWEVSRIGVLLLCFSLARSVPATEIARGPKRYVFAKKMDLQFFFVTYYVTIS